MGDRVTLLVAAGAIGAMLGVASCSTKARLDDVNTQTFGERASGQQARWTPHEIPGGTEFRLQNDAGAQIILECLLDGVAMGFRFPVGPFPRFASIERVTARGIPGQQRNIAVSLRGNRSWSLFEVLTARGRDSVFQMLRRAARLSVRVSPSATTSFEVFGSAATVTQCYDHVEDQPGGLGSPRQPGLGGPPIPIL